jgi:hypothetical protein
MLEREDEPSARPQRDAGRGQHLTQIAEIDQRVRGSHDVEGLALGAQERRELHRDEAVVSPGPRLLQHLRRKVDSHQQARVGTQVPRQQARAAARVHDVERAARLAFDPLQGLAHQRRRAVLEPPHQHVVETLGEAVERADHELVPGASRDVLQRPRGQHVPRDRIGRLGAQPRFVVRHRLVLAAQRVEELAEAAVALGLGPDGERLPQRRERVIEA